MEPNRFIETFLEESGELLASIETAALHLHGGTGGEREAIDQLFRALHTLKGSGAMCGFSAVAAFAHEVETLLDEVRGGKVPVTAELAGLMLAAGDHIRSLLEADQGGLAADETVEKSLLERIRALQAAAPMPSTPAMAAPAGAAGAAEWSIEFRPEPSILRQGGNPELLWRELRELGECVVTGHRDEVPVLEELDAESCYFWWSIRLRTTASLPQLRDVFLFVEDGAHLVIEPLAPEENPSPGPLARGAEGGEESGREGSAAAKAAQDTQAAQDTKALPSREATVRVPASRLDRLVNLVGELVMNQSRLASAAAQFRSPELAGPVEEIERLVGELRDDVLQIRMMPIGSIFGRFRRLVHDLSRQLGKEIELLTEGEETELDKSILDQLGEPLVHLLRNSIDHGIEDAGVREAQGKPRRGTVRLSATPRGSDVLVMIEDDGAGLNRDAIRAKAVAKGLIAADAQLSDKDLWQLILLPGFSTAATITDVSGRGVGMDVVKRQIDALRGTLTLESERGKGTTVLIALPLTLAIIDGLLVESGDSQYIIPMTAVTENVELPAAERCLRNGRNLIAVRGELVPFVDLRESFGIAGEPPELSKIVLVRYEDQRVGLVVDRVMGTHQTVIQALGRFFRTIQVISGCTVMGDGRVALVLDIAGLVRAANGPETERRRLAA
jgi:two-component system chemotaxis sensor kinase CheA